MIALNHCLADTVRLNVEPLNGAERRRHARTAIENVPAALLVAGHDLGLHTITDASEGGAFVCHPSPVVPVGTNIALVLPSTNGRPPMTLNGRIARMVPSGQARPGYGVEWIAPPVDLLAQILELHTARVAPPARAPTPPAHALARTDDLAPAPTPAAAPIGPALVPPEELRAIVIDHDAVHARSVARVLATIGYPAAHETRAKGALELFEQRRRHLVLVLVDFLLPDISGEEMIRRLRKEKPGLAIIATTGVLRTAAAQRPLLHAGANRVLAKPFASDALSTAVRAVLP